MFLLRLWQHYATYTVVYAIFGIPLALLVFKSFARLYNKLLKYFIMMLGKYIRKQHEIRNLEFIVLVLNIVALVAMIVASATVSFYQDDWNMREGIYVWFITFTTVGFGDLIPSTMVEGFQPNSHIIPGLCFMSGVVDALVECAAGLQVDACGRGNCFRCPFCNTLCESPHVDNATEVSEAPGTSLTIFALEAPISLQEEAGNSRKAVIT